MIIIAGRHEYERQIPYSQLICDLCGRSILLKDAEYAVRQKYTNQEWKTLFRGFVCDNCGFENPLSEEMHQFRHLFKGVNNLF